MKIPRPCFNGLSGFFIAHALLFLIVIVPFVWAVLPGHPALAEEIDWSPLVDRLVADGFETEKVNDLFIRPDVVFESDSMSSKLTALIRRKFSPRPAIPSAEPSKFVYEGYLRPEVISGAAAFLSENTSALRKIRSDYCVPEEVVISIILVETRLGENVGARFAFNTLASMALCSELETIKPYLPADLITEEREGFARERCRLKSDWAYRELKALIRYADNIGVDPLSIPGSIYGAIGLCQFMPTNVFLFGIDADEDGRIDLFTTADALHSIANYLKKNGWKCKMDKRSRHRVILSYNRSHVYANTVLAVAEKLKAAKDKK
jgi:membrane-bound lytic murein transglycosylase B